MPSKTLPDLKIQNDNGIFEYLECTILTESDRLEFQANARFEAQLVGKDRKIIAWEEVLRKCDFIRTFQSLYSDNLKIGKRDKVLELGGSHGWACAILKQKYPGTHVVLSNLVKETMLHSWVYEDALGVQIDEKWAFNVRSMPFAADEFDCIFTFAAFHHFFEGKGDYSGALKEILRILKADGKAVFLYEPTAPAFLYGIAHKRANKRQETEGVAEDLVVLSRFGKLCESLGATMSFSYCPTYFYRGPLATMYYFLLSKVKFLTFLMPCTACITVTKKKCPKVH